MSDELARLRDEMRALDREILALSARRLDTARRIGDLKRAQGQPIRNYAVEAEALRLAREAARDAGLREAFAEDVVKLEIRESLRAQEKDRASRARPAQGSRRALVVGGSGAMGRWFVDFLEGQGFAVAIADPREGPPGRPRTAEIPAGRLPHDLVLLATPPSATPGALAALAGRTDGVVADIASLKAPHEKELRALAASGARVTSLHPMWGPSADLLASRNLVVCDCGSPEANAFAKKLFEDTAARIVEMPLAAHDAFMGSVLGLPHATSLVFGNALARLGPSHADLAGLGGPTFEKQVAVAREVASESRALYYEIQRLNPHTPRVLAGLRASLEEMEAALADRARFAAYMDRARAWFEGETP
ncbi:MAG TPA: prephenate dehydrogenase/arogenate dehydrogenase family protein [Candidatus Thermoplasmatota archaeon]|nr:prephenate dehydrogenase/arogenate dehydrogenase family protein [Candidatus Thermoplasmatota archaeon]